MSTDSATLPSDAGIGDLGAGARAFADFLAAAGQRVWQVLPLTITDAATGNSPFSSLSAFALDPLLLSLDDLRRDKGANGQVPGATREALPPGPTPKTEANAESVAWPGGEAPSGYSLAGVAAAERPPTGVEGAGNENAQAPSTMSGTTATTAERVDYKAVRRWKLPRLQALLPSDNDLDAQTGQQFAAFCRHQSGWLEDFALFTALRHRYDRRSWVEWPEDLRDRLPRALRRAQDELSEEISRVRMQQFFLDRQWTTLRRHASSLGIEMLGDLPFYVSHDSADVWCHRQFFAVDRAGRSTSVAGVPPDYFSADGQLWGHPVYDWDALAADGYSWWVERLRRQLELYDSVRIDHFRGFAGFWQVPAGAETAAGGEWVDGPGADLFHHLRQQLGTLPLVAEDLGTITDDVLDLIRELDLPGMRVLQFAFHEDDDQNPHRPANHPRRTIAYTGTHDNNTLNGWLEEEVDAQELELIDRYLGHEVGAGDWEVGAGSGQAGPGKEKGDSQQAEADTPEVRSGSRSGDRPDGLIRSLLASPAEVAILPLQDVLGLGGEARMNRPSQPQGNWEWRVRQDQLTPEVATRLRSWTEQADRSENRS